MQLQSGFVRRDMSRALRILCPLLVLLQGHVDATNGTHENILRDHLFDLKRYDKTVRPVKLFAQPINVSFALRLSKLIELNTKKQLFATDVWVVQTWVNPFLSWNESQHGGIHSLHISPLNMWVPDTVLYNNGDSGVSQAGFVEKFRTYVILDSSGLCLWMAPTTFKSSCRMDVTNFPFDSQTCEMTFGSWTYDKRLLQLKKFYDEHFDAENYTPNGDWTISKIALKIQLMKYKCCEHPYSIITYTFTLNRKPAYHVLYLIAPCIMISLLSLVGFCLPPDCGERVGLSITILLAMSVYLLLASDILPETSDYVPKLGLYYMSVMAFVTLTVPATAVTLRANFSRGKPPKWMMKIFGLKVEVPKTVSNGEASHVEGDLTVPVNNEGLKTKNGIRKRSENDAKKEEVKRRESWMNIAGRFDTMFLIVFTILFIVFNLAIFLSEV